MPSGNGLGVMHVQHAVRHTNVNIRFLYVQSCQRKNMNVTAARTTWLFLITVCGQYLPWFFHRLFFSVIKTTAVPASRIVPLVNTLCHSTAYFDEICLNLYMNRELPSFFWHFLWLHDWGWLKHHKHSFSLLKNTWKKTRMLLDNSILPYIVLAYSWSIGPYLQGFEPL